MNLRGLGRGNDEGGSLLALARLGEAHHGDIPHPFKLCENHLYP